MNKFELFISYQWDIQEKIKILERSLIKQLGIKVWRDEEQLVSGTWLYDEITKGIKNCSVFICCITNKYSLSENCKREIMYAIDQRKKVIALMFENLKISELEGIGFAINPLLRINCYKEPLFYIGEGKVYENLIESIKHYLNIGENPIIQIQNWNINNPGELKIDF